MEIATVIKRIHSIFLHITNIKMKKIPYKKYIVNQIKGGFRDSRNVYLAQNVRKRSFLLPSFIGCSTDQTQLDAAANALYQLRFHACTRCTAQCNPW